MKKMRDNFKENSAVMQSMLTRLKIMVEKIDPKLMEFLVKIECDHMFFCYRSLLINFKREFPFSDIFRVWESIWSCKFSKDFNLFICLAMILSNRQYILVHLSSFDELLKFFNCMKLDSVSILVSAQNLFDQFQK